MRNDWSLVRGSLSCPLGLGILVYAAHPLTWCRRSELYSEIGSRWRHLSAEEKDGYKVQAAKRDEKDRKSAIQALATSSTSGVTAANESEANRSGARSGAVDDPHRTGHKDTLIPLFARKTRSRVDTDAPYWLEAEIIGDGRLRVSWRISSPATEAIIALGKASTGPNKYVYVLQADGSAIHSLNS
eukprot:SAG31_NODE_8493_length_1441_cov_1.772727_2_plen_186_part_00